MRYKHIFVAITAVMLGFGGAYAGTTLTSKDYVDTAVAGKQPAITGPNGYAVTYGASAGAYNQKQIKTSVGSDTSDPSLPTTGAVVKGLNGKQAAIAPGTSGNLVTYSGTEGSVGSATVYNSSNAYDGQTTALVQAQHVNSAITSGLTDHITCHTYDSDPNKPHTPENCWLWQVNSVSSVM